MVAQVNLVDVASVLALNDTKEKFRYDTFESPEEVEGKVDGMTAIEYYNLKYDYYFDILLENSEQ